jgi:type IV pilus assembly protein PilB
MNNKTLKKILQYSLYKEANAISIKTKGREQIISFSLPQFIEETMELNLKSDLIALLKEEIGLPQSQTNINNKYHKFNVGGKGLPTVVSLLEEEGQKNLQLQIIPREKRLFTIRQLAWQKEQLRLIKLLSRKRAGLVIVSGPDNSGKTSTIYSLLKTFDSSKLNISSLEYIIEEDIPGVNQICIDDRIGLDFKKLLSALLKQDSEIIMLEEIKNKTDAKNCLTAAATGRLVFSSLKSQGAIDTLFRLENMGLSKKEIAENVIMIINQRLLRKTCPYCIKKHKLDPKTIDKFKTYTNIKIQELYTGRGCSRCQNTGYQGQIAIHEILVLTEKIKNLVQRESSLNTIQKAAIKEGFITLEQDALLKVKSGITTIDEIIAQKL